MLQLLRAQVNIFHVWTGPAGETMFKKFCEALAAAMCLTASTATQAALVTYEL